MDKLREAGRQEDKEVKKEATKQQKKVEQAAHAKKLRRKQR